MVVGMLIGVVLVPGGHRQFTLWYSQFIALALMMTGLPVAYVFWIYHLVFPPDHCSSMTIKAIHHILSLLLVAMLVFFGPIRTDPKKVK